jgi:CheY-like chemotaxis protein
MSRPQDKTVLVVDDEQDVREYLSTVLEDAGFRVATAADGVQALERVVSAVPDLISLDLVMPNKSGLRFLHDLRRKQEWRDIPVVVVTAHAHDELGGEDFADIFSKQKLAGPSSYLEKPANPGQYVALICEKLGVDTVRNSEETDINHLRRQLHDLIDQMESTELSRVLGLLKSLG